MMQILFRWAPSRAALVVFGFGLTLMAVGCSSAEAPVAASDAEVTFESAGDPTAAVSLPTLDRSDTDPAVGMVAPRVEGVGFDGETVTLAAEGTPQVISFLAHWCPHCQAEMPVVNDWIASGAVPPGVEVIGVATAIDADRDNYPPADWFAKDGPLLLGVADPDNVLASKYGLPGFPYWVAVDANGRVAARAAGNLTVDLMQQLADSVSGDSAPS